MEGDNQRRRALARQARQQGQQPAGTGATFGSSKQINTRDRSERDGPPPVGGRKPVPGRGALPPETPAPPVEPTRPRPDEATALPAPGAIRYRDLVTDVGRRAGVDFEQARAAAEATVLVLAQALDEAGRQRLLDAVPTELQEDLPADAANRRPDLAGFLEEIARLSRRTPEQARYQAQATLSAIADRDGALMESLDLPTGLRELLAPPGAGGGLVEPDGRPTVALTDDELRAALAELPYWSGGRESLSRTVILPPDSLDRVLARLDGLAGESGYRPSVGRAPSIGRPEPNTAVITVRTKSINAVTAVDVDLAHRVDEAIDEAGAGLA